MTTYRRYLDQFKIILLDMNSTFMFGEDRFHAREDFFSTYQRLGGTRLGRAAVETAIRDCYAGMSGVYQDPSRADDFPSLAEGLRKYAAVEEADLALLEAVFTQHELGHIPQTHSDCLLRLSRSHKLGVVSNIWAKKAAWLAEFERAGIRDIWQTLVFSPDSRSIKPSPRLFRQAVMNFDTALSDIVFVGDSLHCRHRAGQVVRAVGYLDHLSRRATSIGGSCCSFAVGAGNTTGMLGAYFSAVRLLPQWFLTSKLLS